MKRQRLVWSGLALAAVCATSVCVLARTQQKTLYEKASPYSVITVTEDAAGLRTLEFDRTGVRQSVVKPGDPDHIELPYARTAMAGLAFCPQPRRILVVGVGGGTIPTFLHKHYPEAAIDAVDIDPDVIKVAREYFGFRPDERLRAHVGDGRKFIEAVRTPYDLIFLDAFGSESIPYHLATREFLAAVRKALAPDGVVVGNIWGRGSNILYDSMVRTYQETFGELYVLDVRLAGNKLLFALPKPRKWDRDALAARAAAVSKAKPFRFDLGELVTYGYQRADEKDPRGTVLRDDRRSE